MPTEDEQGPLETPAQVRKERETGRLEAFSDGVSLPEFCFVRICRHGASARAWLLLDWYVRLCETEAWMGSPRRAWQQGARHLDNRNDARGAAGAALPAGKIV